MLDPEQSYDTEWIKATQFAVLAAKLCQTDHTPDEEPQLVIVRGNKVVASRVKEGLRDFTFPTPPVTYSALLYRYALPAHIARLAAKYLESRVEQAPDSPTPKIEEQRGEIWKTVVEARQEVDGPTDVCEPCQRRFADSTTELLHCWFSGTLGDPDGPPVADPDVDQVFRWADDNGYRSLASYARSYTDL